MTHEGQFSQALNTAIHRCGTVSIPHSLPSSPILPQHPSLLFILHSQAAESPLLVQPTSAFPTLVTTTSQICRKGKVAQVKNNLKQRVRMKTKDTQLSNGLEASAIKTLLEQSAESEWDPWVKG